MASPRVAAERGSDPNGLFTLPNGESGEPQVLRILRRGVSASLRLRPRQKRHDRFCGGCGRLLEREAEAAVDRPEETAGDRRPVAIMFCDLVGYTRLSSKLDRETRRRSAASYGPPEPRQCRFCPGTADLLGLT